MLPSLVVLHVHHVESLAQLDHIRQPWRRVVLELALQVLARAAPGFVEEVDERLRGFAALDQSLRLGEGDPINLVVEAMGVAACEGRGSAVCDRFRELHSYHARWARAGIVTII